MRLLGAGQQLRIKPLHTALFSDQLDSILGYQGAYRRDVAGDRLCGVEQEISFRVEIFVDAQRILLICEILNRIPKVEGETSGVAQ